jgi:hypothetical protein
VSPPVHENQLSKSNKLDVEAIWLYEYTSIRVYEYTSIRVYEYTRSLLECAFFEKYRKIKKKMKISKQVCSLKIPAAINFFWCSSLFCLLYFAFFILFLFYFIVFRIVLYIVKITFGTIGYEKPNCFPANILKSKSRSGLFFKNKM